MNNQNNPENEAHKKTADLGVKNAANALNNLWEKASENLSKEELGWFAGLSSYATMEAKNLSGIVTSIGCLINADADETGTFQDKFGISELLFSVSHQIDTIQGLVSISSDAAAQLIHQEFYTKAKEGGAA